MYTCLIMAHHVMQWNLFQPDFFPLVPCKCFITIIFFIVDYCKLIVYMNIFFFFTFKKVCFEKLLSVYIHIQSMHFEMMIFIASRFQNAVRCTHNIFWQTKLCKLHLIFNFALLQLMHYYNLFIHVKLLFDLPSLKSLWHGNHFFGNQGRGVI